MFALQRNLGAYLNGIFKRVHFKFFVVGRATNNGGDLGAYLNGIF